MATNQQIEKRWVIEYAFGQGSVRLWECRASDKPAALAKFKAFVTEAKLGRVDIRDVSSGVPK